MPDGKDQQFKNKKQRVSEKDVINSVEAVNCIQVNHCKNPQCANFNVPYTGKRDDPNYSRSGSTLVTPPLVSSSKNNKAQVHPAYGTKSRSIPFIKCHEYGECPPLKNNRGINEVLNIWNYHPDNTTCPDEACKNNSIPIGTVGSYKKNGKTKKGTVRWICKSCGKSFVHTNGVRLD